MKVRLELTILDSRDKVVSSRKQVMNIQYRGIYEVLIERIFIKFELFVKDLLTLSTTGIPKE